MLPMAGKEHYFYIFILSLIVHHLCLQRKQNLFLMPHETSAKARIQSKFPDTHVNITCTENSWPAKLAEEILLVFCWCSLVYFNESTNSVPFINHPDGCCSVTQSCLTHCDPMDCSTPGFPLLHHPNGRYYSSFFFNISKWGHWGLERLNNLLRVSNSSDFKPSDKYYAA